MKALSYVDLFLAALFTACCCYQAVYAAARLLCGRRRYETKRLCKYAVLVAARNEEAVVGQLLDSIRAQEYPADLLHIYVVADNCTDGTARVAEEHGARVYRRRDRTRTGKGWALSWLLGKIGEEHGDEAYDGYFVFDADNLLDPRFVSEMNRVFSNGRRVVTGYRNTKNYGENWITAGYGLYFLRESEYLNRPRDRLGVSCAVSGTGYLFADSLLREIGGWDYHLLTEDLEFTADMLVRGEPVAYCGEAVFYDEQPADFRQSVIQRSRWIKGYFQVLGKRGKDLVRTLFATGRFGCYDMLTSTLPAGLLAVLTFFVNAAMLVVGLATHQELSAFFRSVLTGLVSSYGVLYLLGFLTLLTEWKRICCPGWKKALSSFTFPLFLYTFGFALLLALFGSVEWKPIKHTAALSIGDLSPKR